jgi:hypothetical protein
MEFVTKAIEEKLKRPASKPRVARTTRRRAK